MMAECQIGPAALLFEVCHDDETVKDDAGALAAASAVPYYDGESQSTLSPSMELVAAYVALQQMHIKRNGDIAKREAAEQRSSELQKEMTSLQRHAAERFAGAFQHAEEQGFQSLLSEERLGDAEKLGAVLSQVGAARDRLTTAATSFETAKVQYSAATISLNGMRSNYEEACKAAEVKETAAREEVRKYKEATEKMNSAAIFLDKQRRRLERLRSMLYESAATTATSAAAPPCVDCSRCCAKRRTNSCGNSSDLDGVDDAAAEKQAETVTSTLSARAVLVESSTVGACDAAVPDGSDSHQHSAALEDTGSQPRGPGPIAVRLPLRRLSAPPSSTNSELEHTQPEYSAVNAAVPHCKCWSIVFSILPPPQYELTAYLPRKLDDEL